MEDLTASNRAGDTGTGATATGGAGTGGESTGARHAVITGASSGIGRAAAVALAGQGWRVTLVGRDQGRLDQAVGAVRQAATGPAPAALTADFAELAQVRALAEQLSGQHIDVLANNAGVVSRRRQTTVDGHELTIQTNHLAPFLLTSLLQDRLKPGARVITTASMAHAFGTLDPSNLDRAGGVYSAWLAYGGSKRANILFAAEAARRWPELLSFSFHPGVVRTRFGTPAARVFYQFGPGIATPEQGADQLVWLSTADPADLTNGAYYVLRKVTTPHRSARDPQLAAQLWDATQTILT